MIKSLSIASCNLKVLLKSLFCQLLVLALILAFLVTAFGSVANDVLRVISDSKVTDFINSTISAVFDGSFDSATFTSELNTLINTLQQSVGSIRFPWGGSVTLAYFVIAITLLVYRLMVSYTDVTVACQIEEFMTSNAKRPFSWFLFKKQGRTFAFACLQLIFTLPLDILIVCGSLGLYLLFLIPFGWWTIIPVALLLILLYTVRQTFFAFCLPAVASEEGSVSKGFKDGLSQIPYRFWHVFWKNLIVICVMLVISVLSILYINNGWVQTVALTVPNFILFYVIKCINFVEYFEANKRPYFYKNMQIEGTDAYNRKQARLAKRQAKKQAKKQAKDSKNNA